MKSRSQLLPALAALLAVQGLLVAWIVSTISGPACPGVTPLEDRPAIALREKIVSRADLVDAVHVFSGTPDLGADEAPDDFRQRLAFDAGHFSWVMLGDRPARDDGLYRLAGRRMEADEKAAFQSAAEDGILNFFYDLGGREDVFNHNWTAVGVEELQASPLLPWTKKVDFIVLSGYDADHCAGLHYILRGNPAFPVFGPPVGRLGRPHPARPGDATLTLSDLQTMERLLPLPIGLYRLTPRLYTFTYRSQRPREEWNSFETALVLKGTHGWTVVAGSDGTPPWVLVEHIEARLGAPVRTFVGATGYRDASEDPAVERDLTRFQSTHPDIEIIPTYATSPTGHALIRRVFGEQHYRAGLLGSRVFL